MKYTKFVIHKYKAISNPITINVSKNGVFPILGINECGKTTILQAILAFDCTNDDLNQRYKHLEDAGNLYEISSNAEIEAKIKASTHDISDIQKIFSSEQEEGGMTIDEYQKCIDSFPVNKTDLNFSIKRLINGKRRYEIHLNNSLLEFENTETANKIAKKIIANLPTILYYDDFRDSFEDTIEITEDGDIQDGYSLSTMKKVFEETFKQQPDITIQSLIQFNDNQRKSILSKVSKTLNEKIINSWTALKNELSQDGSNRENIKIELEYKLEGKKKQLKIQIVETINDEEKYFDVRNRSKGFYWFFNFTMKTAFNPKNTTSGCIYLFDELGCYLHAAAQKGLCDVIRDIGNENVVIYNTHSHYLLDSQFLPSTKIAQKETSGNIQLVHFSQYKDNISRNEHKLDALQPIREALKVEPSILEQHLIKSNLLLLEGLLDFYSFSMFISNSDIGFIPCKSGVSSMYYYIPLLLSSQKNFICVVDGDKEGEKAKKQIEDNYHNTVIVKNYGSGKKLESFYCINEVDDIIKKYKNEFSDITSTTVEKNKIEAFIKLIIVQSEVLKKEIVQSMIETKKNHENFIESLKLTNK